MGIVGTLSEILKEQWEWRKQILSLGLFDLKKTSAGAVLGSFWFFAKPAVYIFCFWFALEVGLKSGNQTGSDVPYILWLMGGLIPWFYMQDILGAGIDVFKRYSYLVTKIKFPLPGIPTIYSISTMIIQLVSWPPCSSYFSSAARRRTGTSFRSPSPWCSCSCSSICSRL